jgi:hypothetical protein
MLHSGGSSTATHQEHRYLPGESVTHRYGCIWLYMEANRYSLVTPLFTGGSATSQRQHKSRVALLTGRTRAAGYTDGTNTHQRQRYTPGAAQINEGSATRQREALQAEGTTTHQRHNSKAALLTWSSTTYLGQCYTPMAPLLTASSATHREHAGSTIHQGQHYVPMVALLSYDTTHYSPASVLHPGGRDIFQGQHFIPGTAQRTGGSTRHLRHCYSPSAAFFSLQIQHY